MTTIEMTAAEAEIAERGFSRIKDYRADIYQYDSNDVEQDSDFPEIDGRQLRLSDSDFLNRWFAEGLVQNVEEYFEPLDDQEQAECIGACKSLKRKIEDAIGDINSSSGEHNG